MPKDDQRKFMSEKNPRRGGDGEPESFQVVDKRHFTNLDELPSDFVVEEKPRYPTFVEELLATKARTEERFEEMKTKLQEELERTKARLEADFERKVGLEKQEMILPLLEVLDNLERALDAPAKDAGVERLRQGIELTANIFRAKLQALGIEAIPVLDQPFDPNLGQAVGMVQVGDLEQDGIVVEEVLRGYQMGDQLLRAAQVRVGRFVTQTG